MSYPASPSKSNAKSADALTLAFWLDHAFNVEVCVPIIFTVWTLQEQILLTGQSVAFVSDGDFGFPDWPLRFT